jgi:thiol:disulfide interchange protein DsbA
VRLSQPLAAPADGKVEVIEFFWYGCPHCNSFEPMLEAWAKKLPADVAFRRVPVAFREEPFAAHQRIYYALEALGLVEQMHRKVFFAIHNERQRLDKPQDIAAFMAKNGVDSAKFLEAYNSFGVQTKQRQARQLADAYKIDGVPAIGVHGRWFTSGTLAGSLDRSLAVADHLIGLVRGAKR